MRILLVAVMAPEAVFELKMARRLTCIGHEPLVICRETAAAISEHFAECGLPLQDATFAGKPALVDPDSGSIVLPWSSISNAVPESLSNEDLLARGLALEQQYGFVNWRTEVDSEHLYERKQAETCAPDLLTYYPAWEQFLDQWTPDATYTGDGGDNIRTSLLHCLAKRSLPLFYQSWPPIPDHTFFGEDYYYLITARPVDDDHPAMADEVSWARDFLHNVRDRGQDFVINRNVTISLADRARQLLGRRRGQSGLRKLDQLASGLRRRQTARRIAQTVSEPEDEPFAFFPLHLTDDAQLTLRNPLMAAQFSVIDMLARSLPVGMTLYVKEHPALAGVTPWELVGPLLSMKNVKLIHPRWHPHELIRRSRLVCAINSTAGFEALMIGKPVLCLGRPFYSGWGLTHDWTEVNSLPALVRQALSAPLPSEDELVSLLCRLRRQSYPGTHFMRDDSVQNAERTADSLAQAIIDRQADRGHAS